MKNKIKILSTLSFLLLSGFRTQNIFAETKISKNPIELKIHMHYWNRDAYDENRLVPKKATELTNIKLKGVAPKTGTNTMELFYLMLASGDLPDVVGGNSLRDEFMKYGMEGAFVPLNDLIDKHAPNIKKFLNENPSAQKVITAADGNIYYIPYAADGIAGRGYWIRQDWLDKLNLKTPDNTEELYDVLKAFRDNDPNGNGIKDEIPLIFRHWQEMIRLVTLWGGRTAGTDSYLSFYEKDGKVRHGWTEPEFKEGMKNITRWYQEKLIDPEVFTRGSKSREILFGNNTGGMTRDWFASTATLNRTLANQNPGINLQPMAPPLGTDGKRIEEHSRTLLKPDGWAITTSNSYPVETIKYFDFFFDGVGRDLANFGIEGIQYDLVDGKPIFKEEILKGNKPVNNQLYEIGAQVPIGYRQNYEYEKQWTDELAMKGVNMYIENGYIIPEYLPPAMNEEEKKVYDTYWPTISTYITESVQNWVLKGMDIDKEWDGYTKNLEKLGLNKVLDAFQSAHDRVNKK